jgi:hypothetical protein
MRIVKKRPPLHLHGSILASQLRYCVHRHHSTVKFRLLIYASSRFHIRRYHGHEQRTDHRIDFIESGLLSVTLTFYLYRLSAAARRNFISPYRTAHRPPGLPARLAMNSI